MTMTRHERFAARLMKTMCGLSVWVLALGACAQTSAVVDWRYSIRPDDTVSSVARQYLKPTITWQALAKYNRLLDAGVIRVGAQLRIPLHWLAVKQAEAKLTAVSGDVQVQTFNGVWRSVQSGESIQTGDQIRVGINSSARLQFADASELVMQPQTWVVMDTLSTYAGGYMADTQLRLRSGRVEVHANPQGRKGQRFDVTTPAAVASVRGTQFVVEAQDTRTVQLTNEGQVDLKTSQGKVLVQEGFGSAVKLGENPTPPEVIKPAPALQNAPIKMIDFPLVFNWVEQTEVAGWVMQVGRDPQMAQIVLSQETKRPFMDAGALADGSYHLRAWTVDDKGIPSQTMSHTFMVDIPRQLLGPVIRLASQYVSPSPLALHLTPLVPGQRYLVQVTQDAEGRLPVWYQANAGAQLTLPQLAPQDTPYHLWIWVY